MTNANDAPAYTRSHWAKSDRQDHRRIHLLEHHLANVGACFEELLAQPTIRQRLAHSGGLDTLDDATAARLALFAALHDIGKVNTGFQTQIWRDADLPAGPRRPHAGPAAAAQRQGRRDRQTLFRRPGLVVRGDRVLGRPRRRDGFCTVHCGAVAPRVAPADEGRAVPQPGDLAFLRRLGPRSLRPAHRRSGPAVVPCRLRA